jgi:hypothetical protein
MLLETVGGEQAPAPVTYSANPSHAVAPLSVNSTAAVGNGASTSVGNTSGPVVQNGSTTGMTRATESNGLSAQQTVTQIIQGISVKGMTGNSLNQAIANGLASAGFTSDQVQSVLANSGIVGEGTFTQNATSQQQSGWVNQVLAAINLTPSSDTAVDPTTNLPTNNVANDTTTNLITTGNTTVTTDPNTDGSTNVGDPPTGTGSTSVTTNPTTTTGTSTTTGSVTSATDPWASLLGDVLQQGSSGAGASIPQAPETPVATSTTSGGTSSGGSNTLLLLGVLAAGAGGLWYFMHKKHKDAKAAAGA